jgi:hypothetical protein
MDPIKNMVSAADPANNDPSVPDGEAALRRMLTAPPMFSDSLPRNVYSLADRQHRTARIAGVLTLAAVAVTACVLVATNLGSLTTAPAPASSNHVVAPTAAPSFSTTTAPSVAPSTSVSVPASTAPSADPAPQAQEWRTFLSADGKISFDYPVQWTTAVLPGAAGSSAVDVGVANAEGTVVASLHYGPSGGIGGACEGPVPYTVLDSVLLALPYNASASDTITPRFTFRALQEADHVTASYGITSSAAGKDGKSCMFYNVVSGPAEAPLYSFADAFQVNAGGPVESGNRSGAKTFPSMDAALDYMQTPEYLSAKRMITSLKINAG